MTSTRERQQRAAARARLEREMARRQAAARKRRRLQTGIGAGVAVILIAVGTVWLVGRLGAGDTGSTAANAAATPGPCQWLPDDPTANPDLKDVGTPPAGEPRSGVETITITTNRGVIEASMDTAKVPCTAASFSYLASKKFYDNSKCHRLTTQGLNVLQCGDPTGKGTGGPTYKYAEENLPVGNRPTYPAGTLAMAKTQAPSSTGSQFFIVYEDSDLPAEYTVVGTLTKGLDVVRNIAKAGAVDDAGKPTGDGKPKEDVVIDTLRVSPPV